MPTGQVKWFNETKGYGFLSRDDGGEVFVHTKALPAGVTTLRPGQRVEFGVAAGHRGDQAMSVQLLDALPSVAAAQRKTADDMAPIVQDLITKLDSVLPGLQRGRYPSKPEGQKIAMVLRAIADQFDV
ncbi:cold-shock protein [Kitasatospora phosalacinea]|uniref:cold-shock protein n=1 Tax=Kitasatospora phosalacinea TaxID=2065 RepID=UPI0035DDEB5E